MPPKGSRKSVHANPKPAFVPPANAIPQPLPPSVEEAYRRKCGQIRHRYNQIEESNDAARLRLHRLRRQLDKLRVERAFLLEQVDKRTSTNVEDSDGSPSPPPTPKEKPLRTKRGHRKPSMIPDLDLGKPGVGGAMLSQSLNLSPASESFSHSHLAHPGGSQHPLAKPNGVSAANKPPRKPANAFELYCRDTRPVLLADRSAAAAGGGGDGGNDESLVDADVDGELARGWKDLPEKERDEFQARHEEDLVRYQKERDEFVRKEKEAEAEAEAEAQAEAEEMEAVAEAEAEALADAEMEAEVEAEKENDKSEETETKDSAAADDDVEMADSEK